MLECEYIKLMGLESVSAEEFELAESIYMEVLLDKYEFCEDYKKHKGSTIVLGLYGRLKCCEESLTIEHRLFLALEKKYDQLHEKYAKLKEKYDALRFDTYEAKGGW